MASELRVDKIIPTTGVPSGGGGGVIQVTQGSKTSRALTTSTDYVATGLSGTITPKINTSKVLVTVTTTATWSSGAATAAFIIRRKVGGSYIENSPLGGQGHGNIDNPDGATMSAYSNDGSTKNNQMPMTVQWWDSPATTSAITYELWMAANGSSGCGMGGLGDNVAYDIYSQIVMMEVSA
tara:strand:- start:566 stop:1108 length:543 start_codon:yes stop_codon:yes gene_type:complete